MSSSGDAELIVEARAALLDALDALIGHRDAVVVIGAQAVYLHTHEAPVALAEATKDSDIAVDPRTLAGQPLLEEAMRAAGFTLDEQDGQPGMWISSDGLPVDLMVPEALAGVGGRRGARIPPHGRRATRRATGLEAAVVDHCPMVIAALTPEDGRTHMVNVASRLRCSSPSCTRLPTGRGCATVWRTRTHMTSIVCWQLFRRKSSPNR